MQWLIANMWMALAAATFLGLIFGFSFRGLLVGSRVRRAQVEREIAKTELTQTKAEVEALYAAQRKRKEENAQAVGGDDDLQAELEKRESRISELGDALSAARTELDGLRSANQDHREGNPSGAAGAAAARAAVGALLTGGDAEELNRLRDRNAWLEERVATLEHDVGAAIPVGAVETVSEAAAPDQEKLNWQNAYLRQRVAALETRITTLAGAATVAPAAASPAKDTDEELARLRWRNRYLEGRLAYFEEGEGSTEPEEDEAAQIEVEAEAETVAPADEPEPEPAPVEPAEATDGAPAPAPDGDPDEPAPEDVHPSEAMLAELEGVQPEQIERPDDGGDDLTAISGIGPRIAEVLNELGIYTYAQIAEWTPEHATWVENHLSFKGRVGREDWVNQARALLAEA